MGRLKREMKMIHAKKIRKTKKKVKAYLKGDINYISLSRLAKERLKKSKKVKSKTS